MKIGFIGLGIMGRPMAGHLLAAGHVLRGCANRTPLPVDLLASGMIACPDPAAVARESECVILMLPNTPDVESVLFGPRGVAEELPPGATVIDMSSIDPLATKRFAQRIVAAGGAYVDAPVSGGEIGARNASLTIMCGGEEAAVDRVRPLLSLMGRAVTHVGETGAGQVAKVANQIMVALNIEAVAEAFVFAARAGVEPARVREALMGGFAASRVLEVHGQRMIDHSFDPGFRIRLHRKDLGLALDGARELGISLPNTQATQQLFDRCIAAGDGDRDHSAIITALEPVDTRPTGARG